MELERVQNYIAASVNLDDLRSEVIKGVFAAEEGTIAQYNKIIKLCDVVDYVKQGMVIGVPGGEEDHRHAFIGFLKEYEKR